MDKEPASTADEQSRVDADGDVDVNAPTLDSPAESMEDTSPMSQKNSDGNVVEDVHVITREMAIRRMKDQYGKIPIDNVDDVISGIEWDEATETIHTLAQRFAEAMLSLPEFSAVVSDRQKDLHHQIARLLYMLPSDYKAMTVNEFVFVDKHRGRWGPILDELGAGGFGIVGDLQDNETRRSAVKLLAPVGGHTVTASTRFLREFDTMRQLNLESAPTVLGQGDTIDGVPYALLQYIKGGDLNVVGKGIKAGLAAESSLERPIQWQLLVMAAAAQNVEEMHHPDGDPRGFVSGSMADLTARSEDFQFSRQLELADAIKAAGGVVHRDIKPGNFILGSDGRVWLIDFGLVKSEGDEDLTAENAIIGTPQNLAPELWVGKPASVSTDIYAFGCSIFEFITGSATYSGKIAEMMRKHCDENTFPNYSLIPAEYDDLRKLVMDMIAVHPKKRPQSFAAIARRIHGIFMKNASDDERQKFKNFLRLGASARRVPMLDGEFDMKARDSDASQEITAGLQSVLGQVDVAFDEGVHTVEYMRGLGGKPIIKTPAKFLLHHRATKIFAAMGFVATVTAGVVFWIASRDVSDEEGNAIVNAIRQEIGSGEGGTNDNTQNGTEDALSDEIKRKHPLLVGSHSHVTKVGDNVEYTFGAGENGKTQAVVVYKPDEGLYKLEFIGPESKNTRITSNANSGKVLEGSSGKAIRGKPFPPQVYGKRFREALALEGIPKSSPNLCAPNIIELHREQVDGKHAADVIVMFMHHPEVENLSFYVVLDMETGQQQVFESADAFLSALTVLGVKDALSNAKFADLDGKADLTPGEFQGAEGLQRNLRKLLKSSDTTEVPKTTPSRGVRIERQKAQSRIDFYKPLRGDRSIASRKGTIRPVGSRYRG